LEDEEETVSSFNAAFSYVKCASRVRSLFWAILFIAN